MLSRNDWIGLARGRDQHRNADIQLRAAAAAQLLRRACMPCGQADDAELFQSERICQRRVIAGEDFHVIGAIKLVGRASCRGCRRRSCDSAAQAQRRSDPATASGPCAVSPWKEQHGRSPTCLDDVDGQAAGRDATPRRRPPDWETSRSRPAPGAAPCLHCYRRWTSQHLAPTWPRIFRWPDIFLASISVAFRKRVSKPRANGQRGIQQVIS